MIANAWAQGPTMGVKDSNGRRREWTREDAARLARGVVEIGQTSIRIPVEIKLSPRGLAFPVGERCPFCGALKVVRKDDGLWCYGCGRGA